MQHYLNYHRIKSPRVIVAFINLRKLKDDIDIWILKHQHKAVVADDAVSNQWMLEVDKRLSDFSAFISPASRSGGSQKSRIYMIHQMILSSAH